MADSQDIQSSLIYETGFCTKNVYLYVQLNDFQKNATLEVSSSIIST